jgi:hypothetical protein
VGIAYLYNGRKRWVKFLETSGTERCIGEYEYRGTWEEHGKAEKDNNGWDLQQISP